MWKKMLLRVLTRKPDTAPEDLTPIPEVRQRMLAALHDCEGVPTDRLIYAINGTCNGYELWLLRSGIFMCVSQRHGETVAADRINRLLPLFEGRVPPEQLAAVRTSTY